MTDATELKACPFCGHKPGNDLMDVLYPNGTFWRETDGIRHYFGTMSVHKPEGQCWSFHCTDNEVGCGAEVHGDSRQQAIAAWNRRNNGK